ncbi:5-oxoprolinase subunit PxpB [Paenibacillus sp. J2TS4]|uniref:5-oxoprolinase subunit PxpB n=1 Tax=Paenibacillus sp. J2TS4 TaxID=2807194 RepID=UPI001B07DC6F|nr:5-oxoprolinase subunit PxpB [Paenibacillus sp. J2TS4]GIP32478.1 kinase A inhibitor [Paenibacillus sp. J2TS4]
MSSDPLHPPLPRIYPLGESAIVVELGDSIDRDVHLAVMSLAAELETRPFPGLIEVVPAFTSLAVYYDPAALVFQKQSSLLLEASIDSPYIRVCQWVREAADRSASLAEGDGKLVTIPVCYGEEYGPDLEYVAILNGLTPEEVIAIHAGRDYLVYMIGFTPAFPYLGGMSKRIAAPRLSTPRLEIPAGSVGIAGEQTGIYSLPTPGGWRLIGRSPLALFRPHEHPPSLIRAGDTVRFQPISSYEYKHWEGRSS